VCDSRCSRLRHPQRKIREEAPADHAGRAFAPVRAERNAALGAAAALQAWPEAGGLISEQERQRRGQGNAQPHHGYRHGIIDRHLEHLRRPLPSPGMASDRRRKSSPPRRLARSVAGCRTDRLKVQWRLPVALLVRLRGRGFLNMGFAAGLALESIEIGQSAKPQRFPNKPHRLGAADTSRPRQHRLALHGLASTLAQHEQSSGSVVDLPPQARPRRAYEVAALRSRGRCLNCWQ
jgi:hypothetical protein